MESLTAKSQTFSFRAYSHQEVLSRQRTSPRLLFMYERSSAPWWFTSHHLSLTYPILDKLAHAHRYPRSQLNLYEPSSILRTWFHPKCQALCKVRLDPSPRNYPGRSICALHGLKLINAKYTQLPNFNYNVRHGTAQMDYAGPGSTQT